MDYIDKLLEKKVNVEFNGFQVLIVIAQIQLALRHPGNRGESAPIAYEIAKDLQDKIKGLDPEVDYVIEKGWNPYFDC